MYSNGKLLTEEDADWERKFSDLFNLIRSQHGNSHHYGKGGTGKSMISAALATIGHEVVLADCDVDAANLHLLFDPIITEEQNLSPDRRQ